MFVAYRNYATCMTEYVTYALNASSPFLFRKIQYVNHLVSFIPLLNCMMRALCYALRMKMHSIHNDLAKINFKNFFPLKRVESDCLHTSYVTHHITFNLCIHVVLVNTDFLSLRDLIILHMGVDKNYGILEIYNPMIFSTLKSCAWLGGFHSNRSYRECCSIKYNLPNWLPIPSQFKVGKYDIMCSHAMHMGCSVTMLCLTIINYLQMSHCVTHISAFMHCIMYSVLICADSAWLLW